MKTIVDNFIEEPLQSPAWIVTMAGKRSTDDTWGFMNGTELKNNVDQHCLAIKLCKNSKPQYIADNCYEKTSHSGLLCQYDPDETGSGTNTDTQIIDYFNWFDEKEAASSDATCIYIDGCSVSSRTTRTTKISTLTTTTIATTSVSNQSPAETSTENKEV
ncbi:hypothetical protein LSH36_688g01000 [Paralvinella palmiformis]|uniref:Uncharacterized protein n=1 Tax=Paralvinella palmiformis TaxID=53620 RepID=A0AAD9MV66_9ANNE|nr:hypothetical protein LSH36_688g01000 [Paralvinella palmiformis]